jgi:hypothetical protein
MANELTAIDGQKETSMVIEQLNSDPVGRPAREIPVAHTPPGGYGAVFPKPFLTGCLEPLAAGAPDLRGMWQVTEVKVKGKYVAKHSAYSHFERVEQCGDRIIVTAGGVVHDMRCDGIAEHGVNDVAVKDFKTRITVVATYENGVHVLRPIMGFRMRLMALLLGYKLVVTRQLEGADMIWTYPGFTARLRRTGGPDAPPPVCP